MATLEEIEISNVGTVTVQVLVADCLPGRKDEARDFVNHAVTYQLPRTAVEYSRQTGQTRYTRTVLDAETLDVVARAFDDAKKAALAQVEAAFEARKMLLPPGLPEYRSRDNTSV